METLTTEKVLSSEDCRLLSSILHDGQHSISQDDRKAIQSIVDSHTVEGDDISSQPVSKDDNTDELLSVHMCECASGTSSSTVLADSSNCPSDCTVTVCGSELSQSSL